LESALGIETGFTTKGPPREGIGVGGTKLLKALNALKALMLFN
jgi:hypothetical protein